MRYFYSLLFYLLLPFIFIRLVWKSRGMPAYRERLSERLGIFPYHLERCIWVHAVSMGETIAAVPLIKLLQSQFPELAIVVTTMTPTGAERVKTTFGDTVIHAYLPYDLPHAMSRFLKQFKPLVCILMETELWPNLIAACDAKKIPVCLVNARLSAKSAAGYQRVAMLTREMLSRLTFIAAHGKADAERFIKLGAAPQRMSVTGNIKFDIQLPDDLPQK